MYTSESESFLFLLLFPSSTQFCIQAAQQLSIRFYGATYGMHIQSCCLFKLNQQLLACYHSFFVQMIKISVMDQVPIITIATCIEYQLFVKYLQTFYLYISPLACACQSPGSAMDVCEAYGGQCSCFVPTADVGSFTGRQCDLCPFYTYVTPQGCAGEFKFYYYLVPIPL